MLGAGWLRGAFASARVRGRTCLGVAVESRDPATGPLFVLLRGITALKVDRRTNSDVRIAIELPEADHHAPDQLGDDALVRRAMAKLDAKYREPLLMQVLGGFSCEEIAAELGSTPGAVMTQVFRARQKLKAALGGYGEEGKVYELP